MPLPLQHPGPIPDPIAAGGNVTNASTLEGDRIVKVDLDIVISGTLPVQAAA